MNLGHKVRALDTMHNSRLWITLATLGRELKALLAMNSFRLWLT